MKSRKHVTKSELTASLYFVYRESVKTSKNCSNTTDAATTVTMNVEVLRKSPS